MMYELYFFKTLLIYYLFIRMLFNERRYYNTNYDLILVKKLIKFKLVKCVIKL